MENKSYQVALYCRLSHDDGDRAESDSIVNQQRAMEDFCARCPELAVASVYVDNGFTGTNFNRPDFKRMLADIESGAVNCVMVKDLSRFGRDYIDIGFYLERYFPSRDVRFIAVNDGVDSRRGPYDMMLPLKNVFNAQYARDTSDKVRKSFRAKQRRGESVSAFAPYGYRKAPENKNHFVVDREAAETVRYIFEQKAKGATYRDIARSLNKKGVLSPIEYKRSAGICLHVNQKCKGPCLWSDSAIKRILTNETYLGKLVSNRYPSDIMHGKHRAAPKSEWIIVEDAHEPIVSRELWDAAQANLPIRKKQRTETAARVGLFAGYMRCGDCGRALVRKGGGSRSYLCSAYMSYGEFACSRHAVSEEVLTNIVLTDLNQVIARGKDAGGHGDIKTGRSGGARTEKDNGRAEAAIAKARRQKQDAYEDYRAGYIARAEYVRVKKDYDRQETLLKQRRQAASAGAEISVSQTAWAEELAKAGRLERLDRETLEQTVREIRVFEDMHLEVVYLFSEEMRNVVEKAAETGA